MSSASEEDIVKSVEAVQRDLKKLLDEQDHRNADVLKRTLEETAKRVEHSQEPVPVTAVMAALTIRPLTRVPPCYKHSKTCGKSCPSLELAAVEVMMGPSGALKCYTRDEILNQIKENSCEKCYQHMASGSLIHMSKEVLIEMHKLISRLPTMKMTRVDREKCIAACEKLFDQMNKVLEHVIRDRKGVIRRSEWHKIVKHFCDTMIQIQNQALYDSICVS